MALFILWRLVDLSVANGSVEVQYELSYCSSVPDTEVLFVMTSVLM